MITRWPYESNIDLETAKVVYGGVRYGIKAMANHPTTGERMWLWIDSNLNIVSYPEFTVATSTWATKDEAEKVAESIRASATWNDHD